jgi:predicted nucleic acid-binding protein
VILVDSNIPMYLIGQPHPLKATARRLVEDALAAGDTLCTDAEVYQEILHRYRSQHRDQFIDPAFDVLSGVVDVIYPIERADVERARRLLATTAALSARDAIHVAVMQARDLDRILSFDRAFDSLPGITRIGG